MDKKHRIKIAQVIGNAQSGGVISCVLNFYRNIDRERFQFDFFIYGKSHYDEEIRALGGRVFYFNRLENLPKSYLQLKNYFEQENYYAVHAHLTTLSFLPLFAAKMAKVPHRICHAHSTTHKKEKFWAVKSILKRFSKRFATNLSGCSIYSCNWLYGSMDNVFLLHNAIDLERFSYSEKDIKQAEQYGWGNKKVIGSIGRLVWQKNFPFLLNAFALVSEKVHDAMLVIVGSGKDKSNLQKQIDKLNLGDKVHIMPEITEVESYYKTFDLFVMTSRFEGLPLVAVEAQAMGVPCLLSKHITDEVNISGQCQFLPTQREQVWAEKMIEMLNYPRFDATTKLIEAGYEIKSEAIRLQNFYLERE